MRVRKNDTGQLSADADSVTYGDAITATAVLPMDATATSVSFSVNGGAAQVVEVDENGAASISFNTASFEGLVVGQNIVGASYVQEDGNGGTTTVTATATFQMEPYTVLAISSVEITKTYDGTAAAPEDFSLALWDVVPGDEGKVGIAAGVAAAFDVADAGERTLLVEQGSVKLAGERAGFYKLESDPSMYEFAGTIEQALPALPEGSSVMAVGSLVAGDTLDKATLSGSFVSPVTGAAVVGTLAWDAPGTVLAAGENQQFAWTFTPDDANYGTVHGTAAVTVAEKADSGGSGGSGDSGGGGGSGTGTGGSGGKDAASGATLAQTGDGLQAPILGAALLACAAASALTAAALRRRTNR